MDGEFPEQFKCPVCFEIPKKEIYQCQNGHTICNICVESLSLCPQCRVGLGTPRIRSRPLEEILDMMKFDCEYKAEGCETKVTRKDLTTHSENCLLGGTRVHLCEYLGYTCSHTMNTQKIQGSLEHFQQEHQSISTTETSLNIKLKNIKNVDRQMRCLWKPLLVNAFNSHFLLVICTVESNISFMCISIGEKPNEKVQVKFRVVANVDDISDLEWITKPISHIKCKALLNYPPLQFSIDLLVEKYMVQDDLAIHVSLSDNNLTIDEQYKKLTDMVMDSFVVVQPLICGAAYQSTASSMQHTALSFQKIVDQIQARNNRTFSFNVNCNICGVMPLDGLRFKCLSCRNYNLCIRCMEKMEHSGHYFVIICTSAQEKSLQESRFLAKSRNVKDETLLRCQKCKSNPPDYVCLKCRDSFGLCKFCFIPGMLKGPADHFFMVTPNTMAREYALLKYKITASLKK